ncbi:MAG: PliI family lysozyme inhibitor of I-type lysozyme [Longimicrobiales bacterium]
MRYFVIGVALLSAAFTLAAREPTEMLETKMRDGRLVIVSDGPKEAASVGSYVVHVYGASNPQSPTDDYVAGIVMPRDGSLLRLEVADIGGGGSEELVVITETAGSGSYLWADAFRLSGDHIAHIASVHDVAPSTDLIAALRERAGIDRST